MKKGSSWQDLRPIISISSAPFWGLVTGITGTTFIASTTGLRAGENPALKPNIILVLTDDQGYGYLGRQGHPLNGVTCT